MGNAKILRVGEPWAKQEYSRQDVCRMLAVTERQLRTWEAQGLIPGAGTYSFSDLIALRTIRELRGRRIPVRVISRALASLGKKLAHIERPLSELKISSDGRRITVQLSGQKMEAISGQMLFDFDTAELGDIRSFRREEKTIDREREAERYFQQGLMLEETGAPVAQAIQAYEKAVELNPSAAGALVNLGTICYRLRKYGEAETWYRRAVEVDADYPLAHFNLGNLYDERGDAMRARQSYSTALRLYPNYADAHFNLALLSEKTGDPLNAVRHWKTYLKLDPSSSWAVIARRQLEKLRTAAVIEPR